MSAMNVRLCVTAAALAMGCGPKRTVDPAVHAFGSEAGSQCDALPLNMAALPAAPAPPGRVSTLIDGLTDERAPAEYDLILDTNRGRIVARIHREWSPNAADRVWTLTRHGYYDNSPFYRVIPGFVAQFGLGPYPEVNRAVASYKMPDDTQGRPIERGTLAMARSGRAHSRTAQLFLSGGSFEFLQRSGYGALGEVVQGMDVLQSLEGCYGEQAPRGQGPPQSQVAAHGEGYLAKGWPRVDRIRRAKVKGRR